MSILNKKDCDKISAAIDAAHNSNVLMRHGCVAVMNGRIITSGYNHYRTRSKNGLMTNTCTCHAECHVMHRLKNLCYDAQDFKKIKLYIVRINKKDELRSSAPCVDCYNMLVNHGVKRIVYSTGNGFQKTLLKDFTPTQITTGRHFLNGNYDKITDDKIKDDKIKDDKK